MGRGVKAGLLDGERKAHFVNVPAPDFFIELPPGLRAGQVRLHFQATFCNIYGQGLVAEPGHHLSAVVVIKNHVREVAVLKSAAVDHLILKVSNAVKTEDLNKRRDDFIRDNLRVENNGAGVIVTDAKYDYTPLQDKTTPIPSTQLQYIKEEIYDYFGVSKEIVENKATQAQESAFYSGEIAPFFRKLTQAFTNCIFTEREIGHGNRIVFSANSIQFATLTEKVSAAKFLTEIGAATLDQILTMFDMPTIGGEDGARRVQTLNMVNAALADKYQTGQDQGPPQVDKAPTEDSTPPEDTPPGKNQQKESDKP